MIPDSTRKCHWTYYFLPLKKETVSTAKFEILNFQREMTLNAAPKHFLFYFEVSI